MADSAENGERLAAFGRWLARERELRGLGRDEVTRVMKLAPGIVEALESGEEARMPPRVYAVGYLRAYAAAVGLDPDEAVLRFEEAMGPPQAARPGPTARPSACWRTGPPQAARPGPPPAGGPPASRRRAAAVAVALAAALAACAWSLLR